MNDLNTIINNSMCSNQSINPMKNFGVVNADGIYVINMDDDKMGRIKLRADLQHDFETTSGCDNNLLYRGFYILEKTLTNDFEGARSQIKTTIRIIKRCGYYMGYNLDFDLFIEDIDGYPYYLSDYASVHDLVERMVSHCWHTNTDLMRYRVFLEGIFNNIIQYANKVLKDLSDAEYKEIISETILYKKIE